jgi:hypothetical protein
MGCDKKTNKINASSDSSSDRQKHFLIVTYSYKPVLSPRAFRWASLSEYWSQTAAAEIDIVCAWKPGLAVTEIIQSVRVFRTGKNFFEIFRTSLKKSDLKGEKKTKAFSLKIISLVKKTYALTWKKLYWPDFACLWYFSAIKKADELLQTYTYDALITVSHPFTSHLVGKSLKKKYKNLTWLVDIGDSFSYAREMPLNNLTLYRGLNIRTEAEIFHHATKVIVTNFNARRRYNDLFGNTLVSHISVIGPLVSSQMQLPSHSPVLKSSNNKQINLVFTGNLINPVRKPALFFAWIRDIFSTWQTTYDNIYLTFHIFGDSPYELQNYLTGCCELLSFVEFYGKVERETAFAAIEEAHIVINCGNITDYQLPSKVYDYIVSGKPLINLVFNPSDPTIEALKGYEPLLHFFIGSSNITEAVSFIKKSSDFQKDNYCKKRISVIKNHSIESIAKQYMDLI